MKETYAILILSCDKYQDLWAPFFEQFWKNWPDCPYTVYLGSNSQTFHHKNVKNILSGNDPNWSTSFKKILEKIPEKYVFVFLEDTFITKKITTSLFSNAFHFMNSHNANHLHFIALPNSVHVAKKSKFMQVEQFTPYRAHVIGFWKKEYLYKLLLDGENPWNFEIMGSYRTSYDKGFFSLDNQLYTSIHMVKKDMWIPKSLDFSIKHRIKIDVSRRRKLRLFDIFLFTIKEYYFTFVYYRISWKLRLGLMNILRKALLSY